MGLDVLQETDALESALGSLNLTTTDKVQGKLGTDTEMADRSLFDILTGDGPASYPAAAAPANDVSLAEVLRSVYNNVSGVDGSTNVLGVDDSDNGFASTNVAANRDGSVLERSEFLIQAVEKSTQSASQTLSSGATIFTVANGPVAILSLQSVCQNENSGGAATTVQWRNAPTVGTANTFTGASASLASAVAGSTVSLDGTALTTAPTVLLTGGAQLDAIRSIIVQAGVITTTVANGPSTGSYIHYIRYCPLTPTAVVT